LFRQAASQSRSLFGRLVPRFELGRTEKAEASLLKIFDHILVTSTIDRDALLNTIPKDVACAPITVLSNGVDQEYFKPNPAIPREPETLVFSGKMSYHANISMVKYLVAEIMPLIWQHRPNVRLYVVGKDPTTEIRRMGENPLIQVTGTVPDIRPFLWSSTVAVAPSVYGAGVQNKILEAMAVGLPVVTTSKALISLGVTPEREIFVGDTPAEFTSQVLNLLDNSEARTKTGKAALAYVEKEHHWGKITKQLVDIYGRQILSRNADFVQ
jgi:glycosyltransferase involved in cell wall biosynthesis